MTSRRLADATPAQRRKTLAKGLGSMLAVWTGLLLCYFLLPIGQGKESIEVGTRLVGGLVLLFGAIAWQFRAIRSAEYPHLRAMQALGSLTVLFLVVFATAYVSVEVGRPGSFSQPLDQMAALYFTTTVFATVGFGDIAPVSEAARAVVTLQMFLGLILIGSVARIFLSLANTGLGEESAGEGPAGGGSAGEGSASEGSVGGGSATGTI